MTVGAALFFGNANYRHLGGLVTPLDDIETLGERTKALGLDTYIVPDADLATMGLVIEQFGDVVRALPTSSSVIVYFAGHGVQRAGENYLLPVDAHITGDTTLRLGTVSLSFLLESLCWRGDQQKLVAIDACRTHRIPTDMQAPTSGLSQVSLDRHHEVRETRVLFATQPGWIASDGGAMQSSPCCRGLLKAFEEPDRPLVLLTTHVTQFVAHETRNMQIPWDSGTISDFRPFLSPPSSSMRTRRPTVDNPSTAAVGNVDVRTLDAFADPAVAKMGHLIHKLKAKDTAGRWAYYFVLVEPRNEARFMEAIKGSGTMDLADYGFVVASNFGERPSSEVLAYLRSRYGFAV